MLRNLVLGEDTRGWDRVRGLGCSLGAILRLAGNVGTINQNVLLYYFSYVSLRLRMYFFYVRRELESRCGGGMYCGEDVGQLNGEEFVIRPGSTSAPEQREHVARHRHKKKLSPEIVC